MNLSATIITLNEEKNLPRCLESLAFCDEIIVVDSGSTDHTVEIAKNLGVRVIIEPWHGYGAQKNFAMSLAKHPWVLNIDADEVITPELRQEIIEVTHSKTSAAGYWIARKTFYMGRWIKYGGWYPNYVLRLAQKDKARWTEPHVHEALTIRGETKKLTHPMLHYTFGDIADQVQTNMRYAKQGALDLHVKGINSSRYKLLAKPFGKFIETYFLKKGFLDGLPGFIISINAAHSMFLKYTYLIEMQNENTHH